MGHFILFSALLLLVAAIVLLVILVQGPENAWAKQIFEMSICEEGEEIVQWLGNYVPRRGSSGGGRETAFYCENSEGEQRDVTLNAVGIMIGGFAIPFVSSLLLFFVAAGLMASNRMKAATKNVFDLSGGSPVWNAMNQPQGTMRNQGLISAEEYSKLRQAILDNLDN